MKRIIMILFLVVFSTSCRSDSKKVDSSSGNDIQIEDSQKRMSNNPEDLKELLSEKTPFTEVEIKEAFPKSMNGLPLDGDLKVNNQQAFGIYGDNEITIQIYDFAGSKGGMAILFNTV